MNSQSTPSIKKTETIFATLVRITMYFLIALYPFGIAAYEIYQKNRGLMGLNDKILVGSIVIFIFGSCVILWKLVPRKASLFQLVGTCVMLFLLSFCVRVLSFSLLQTTPISDFNECYKYAAGISEGNKAFLANFQYLGCYSLTLKLFFKFVEASVFNAQLLNALATSLISCFLYVGVYRVTKRANMAIIAGISYALFPSMIVYCAIPSCEHFAQTFLAASVCFLAFFYSEKHPVKRIVYGILSGIAVGLTCLYKELFILIAPAFLMASFCFEITPLITSFIKTKHLKAHLSKLAYIVVTDILVLVVSIFITNTIVDAVQIEIIGTTNERNAPISATIYEGLCIEGGGVWNPDVKTFVAVTLQEAETPKEADKILYTTLYNNYKENPRALLNLIHEKLLIDWCDEGVYYYWTFVGEPNILQGHWVGDLTFNIPARMWFMIMSATICLGSLLSLRRKDSAEERQFDFIVTGIVFLFAIALVLMEAQGRYKSNISPLICVMFSMCLVRILDTADTLYQKLINIIKNKKELQA